MARILNLAKINARLGSLPKKARIEARAALEKNANELAATQRALAPQGATGNLRRSIRVVPGDHELHVRVVAGGELTTTEVRGGSGVPFDYSLAVEFGTVDTGADPFFYSPYRLSRKRMTRRAKRALSKAAKEAARG